MRKIFTLFVLLLCLKNTKAQYVTIPDSNFATWLQANFPAAMSGNQMDTTSSALRPQVAITLNNLNITDLTGIQFFDSLVFLQCSNNNLTSLPPLPNTLTNLWCIGNQLTSLPTLPSSLIALWCAHNQLTSLPVLPNGLIDLRCDHNQITTITGLPNSLDYFFCGNNQLTNLPVLPNGISDLMCDSNLITILPTLPTTLEYLYCSHNQLTNLPALPNTLYFLVCNYNFLNSLPAFPTSLEFIDCNHNNILCFAPFNTNSIYLDILNNPITCLPNYVSIMDSTTLSYPLCFTGNANGCIGTDGIFGFTYKDNNSNCIRDLGDIGINNIPLKIFDNLSNLIGHTNTLANGSYRFSQTSNSYLVSIDTAGLPYTSSCLNPGFDSTLNVGILDTNINFELNCKPGFDLGIQSINRYGITFPGQPHTLNINAGDISHWYNLNCASGISGSIAFSVSGPITYIGSAFGSLNPSISGNTYTYIISDFANINNSTDFRLIFKTDTTAQAGNEICISAIINPITGDNNPSNNTYYYCYHVVNSLDPNIKEVYPIDVQPGFNDWLTYTIHFQNTGNAPAYNIRLADTLDNMLDLETFQIINYSHPNTIDLTGNILNVRYPNIMLPDSASNPAGSIGFIQYRIKPKVNWVAPYKIKNTAYIYFDYNSPIVTNTTYNSIIVPTGLNNESVTLATLYPNPTNGTFNIELNTKEKQLLQVFDMNGSVVLSQTIENGQGNIDASNLSAGVYTINIKGNSTVINKKVVIVK